MRKTKIPDTPIKQIATDANGLAQKLGCGRATAVKIGVAAGARIQVGKRVLFKIDKVEEYLNEACD